MIAILRQWYRSEGAAVAVRPARPVHDVDHVTAMRLVVRDTYVWKRSWANWRVCFAYGEEGRQSFQSVSVFVRDEVARLCQGEREAIAIAIYLRDQADLKAIFRTYASVEGELGQITSIQSREVYEQGIAIGEMLAKVSRVGDTGDAAILDMPDLAWNVVGVGNARVASAGLYGQTVTVRCGGQVDGAVVWLVDVDEERGCAAFRSRADALSKFGVAAGLKRYRLRQIEARKNSEV